MVFYEFSLFVVLIIGGQLPVLNWLEARVDVDRTTAAVCTAAARGGDMRTLAHLREAGFRVGHDDLLSSSQAWV